MPKICCYRSRYSRCRMFSSQGWSKTPKSWKSTLWAEVMALRNSADVDKNFQPMYGQRLHLFLRHLLRLTLPSINAFFHSRFRCHPPHTRRAPIGHIDTRAPLSTQGPHTGRLVPSTSARNLYQSRQPVNTKRYPSRLVTINHLDTRLPHTARVRRGEIHLR